MAGRPPTVSPPTGFFDSQSLTPSEDKLKKNPKKGLRSLFRHVSGSKHSGRSETSGSSRSSPIHLDRHSSPSYTDVTARRADQHVSNIAPPPVLRVSPALINTSTQSTRSNSLSDRESLNSRLTATSFLEQQQHRTDGSLSPATQNGMKIVESRQRRQQDDLAPSPTPSSPLIRSLHAPDGVDSGTSGCEPITVTVASPTPSPPTGPLDLTSSEKPTTPISRISNVDTVQKSPPPSSSSDRPRRRSPIDETGDVSTEYSDQPEVDEELTLLKLEELRQYVKQLEASIRSNESARKNLDDWLFEQLTGLTLNPPEEMTTSESEIKRMFEDKSKSLKHQAKILNDQLQATQYIVRTLEARGIPKDVSPKTYVRELLKRRGKGLAPGVPLSSKSPSAREESSESQLAPAPKRERPANTLPAIPSASSLTPDTRRNAKTLPTERTYSQEISSLRRTSDPEPPSLPLFQPSPLLSSEAKLKPTNSSHSLSRSGQQSSLEPLSIPDRPQFVPATNISLPAAPFTCHPTSPDLFSINYVEEPVESGVWSKPLRVSLPLSDQKSATPRASGGGGVFNTVRHGLEMFGRQFRRPRSASDENVMASAAKLAGYSRPSKPSSRLGKTGWMGPLSKRTKKTASPNRNSLDPSMNLGEPTGLQPDHTPNRSRISHSGSVCSTSALPVSASVNPFINSLSMPIADRSMSAYSGSTPLKEELLPHPVGQSVGGSTPGLVAPPPDYGDNALSKIFELLSLTMPSCQNQGIGTATRASSGSSVSIPGPSGSNGPKSAPMATAEPLGTAASSTVLNSALLSTPYSHTPVQTGNVALALTAFYRMWTMQLSNLTAQQTEGFQTLRNELTAMRRDQLQLHETSVKLAAELGSISRDAQTREELHKQKLSDATTRIEKLDATAEESRQAMQRELVLLRNEFRDTWAKLEYQLTTKTRDLNDSITTISNRVTIIEKPAEQQSGTAAHSSELSRIRHKVLHHLTDMCVSLFALFTMLLQVLIRCLNMGAVVTENRTLALCFSIVLAFGVSLVYISEPLIHGLSGSHVANFSAIPSTGIPWRDNLITILSFFRRFSRGSS